MLGASLFGSSPVLPVPVSSVISSVLKIKKGDAERDVSRSVFFDSSKDELEHVAMGPRRRVLWDWVTRYVAGEGICFVGTL